MKFFEGFDNMCNLGQIIFKDLQNHIQYIYSVVQTLDNFRISILKRSRN